MRGNERPFALAQPMQIRRGGSGWQIRAALLGFNMQENHIRPGGFQAGEQRGIQRHTVGEQLHKQAAPPDAPDNFHQFGMQRDFSANQGDGLQPAKPQQDIQFRLDFRQRFDAFGLQVVAIPAPDVAAPQNIQHGMWNRFAGPRK